MLRNIFAKTLRDRRRSMIWWIVGSFGYLVAITATYSFFIDQQQVYQSLLENYPEALLAMFGVESGAALFSPDGYLTSQAFGWLVPLLTLVLGIGIGAGAVAGEEEDGTMDLLLALPVTRTSLILQKLGAMIVLLLVLGVAVFAGTAVGAVGIDMDVSMVNLAAASLSAVLFGLVFGTLALAIGAATGKRGVSLGVSSGVALVAFLIQTLAPIVDWLEPAHPLTPFYYYGDNQPLVNGLHWGHAGVLIGLSALLVLVAVLTFRRRDIGV
ncbi:MAG TPA: ABC transporter permease subunit [Acidimicrobiia bacterium]|nr:ABC transporter permease subunit [Acidimicrobiia bacterium]